MTPTPIYSKVTKMGMTRSEKTVLNILSIRGRTLSSELPKHTRLAVRTVNLAAGKLLKKNLIRRIPNLSDMRTVFYEAIEYPVEISSSVQTAIMEANI